MMSASHDAAAQALRELDPVRYHASLVLPEPGRAHVQALLAFSAEVASVRERVSEPGPGEIRLQWWADAISGTEHGDARRNPLADALLQTIAACDIPTGPLLRLVSARRFDLYQDPMPDMAQFEGYAGETVSILYQLAASILGGGAPLASGDAAGHLGVADALLGHLRAFGFNAARGQLFLPLSVFTAHGVSEQQIFSGSVSDGLLAARAALVAEAREHLEAARTAIAQLPRQVRPAFARATLLEDDARRLERQSAKPFATMRPRSAWRNIAALLVWCAHNG